MRNAVSFLLAVASLVIFAVAANWRSNADYPVWNQTLMKYKVPNVPPKFDQEITYLSKTPGQHYETDDGPTVYLRAHQSGWNDCLHYFYQDWSFLDNQPAWSATENEFGEAPWSHGAPLHINHARRDGWLKCAGQIRTHLKSNSESDFRHNVVIPQTPNIVTLICLALVFMGLARAVMTRRTINDKTDQNE